MDILIQRRWRWWDSIALSLYASMVALGVAIHQPWADEAQAWLIARDNGWWQIVAHRVRYEGTPALWHTLLWMLARLHFTYAGMHWACGAVAVGGIFVLLRWSPFPAWLRLLLPFTFYFAYQDAVIARSYVLFAVLAFSCTALLRSRNRPLLLALLIGLTANVSVHGFIAAVGLAIAFIFRWRTVAQEPLTENRDAGTPRLASETWIVATALVALLFAVAIATAWPPPDVNFSAGKNIEKSISRTRQQVGVDATQPLRSDHASGELQSISPRVHRRTSLQSAATKLARIVSVITFPLSEFRLLGLALFLLLVTRGTDTKLYRLQIGWTGLLPYLLMVTVFSSLYLAPRHTGMLFTAFIAAVWLTWPAAATHGWRGSRERIFMACLMLMCVEQIGWTIHALRSELRGPYSGDRETARFLARMTPGSRLAGFYYHSVGVLAYFDHNIFFNQPPHSYWLWSSRQRLEAQAPRLLASRPSVIVVGGWKRGPQSEITSDWLQLPPPDEEIPFADTYRIIPFFQAHGYRITHLFCGNAWMRSRYDEQLCDVVLQPTEKGAR